MNPHLFAHGNQRTRAQLRRIRRQALADHAFPVALRAHAILLSLDRYGVTEIARILEVHRSTVHLWIQRWNDQRDAALYSSPRRGRPARLSEEQREMLSDILESGPVAYGFLTGVWTSPLIGQVIESEFQISYHPGHVRKLLRPLGFSLQRPTTKAVQADPRQQRKWSRYTYPDLKKSPGGGGLRDL